jgi:hypothetical protein
MKWYLRQLLPMHYCTVVGGLEGVYFVRWRMWMGRCFARSERLVSRGNLLNEHGQEMVVTHGPNDTAVFAFAEG